MPSPRASLAVLAVLAAALLAAPQALGAAQLRIVGGSAPSQAWPAQTWVRVKGYGKTATCGGTLVSARWVITAGHCVTAPDLSVLPTDAFNDSKSSNKLRVGSVDHKNGGFTSDVDGVIRIPTYNNPAAGSQPTYDLGLLHLKDVAPQDPLALIDATAADVPFWSPGVSATVLGWGRTENASSSSTLLEARVPIVSDGDCAAAWPAPSAEVPSPFSPFSMVCAGGTTTDTCEGDSGGPLIAPRNGAPTLVGVTSWGSGPQCAAGKPGVYVRLGDPAINEWVRSWVPAVVLTSSAATAVVSEPVEFSAAALGSATVEWDTNADGVFGDAGGPSLSLSFASIGIHAVAARATYPDGDRTAIARTTLDVTEAPPPPAPGTSPRGGGSGAAAPGTTGTTGTTATTATTTDAAGNRVSVTTQMKLRTLRERGVRVRFECATACSITGRLKLGPVLARRYHLGRTSITIARGTARLSKKGTGVLTLRLTAKPKRALRNAGRITTTLRTELRAGDAALRGARAITVRR